MEQIVLDAKKRAGKGSADSRRLRQQGLATGNIYGHGEPNVSFTVESDEDWRRANEAAQKAKAAEELTKKSQELAALLEALQKAASEAAANAKSAASASCGLCAA